jgi:hypothetical protein
MAVSIRAWEEFHEFHRIVLVRVPPARNQLALPGDAHAGGLLPASHEFADAVTAREPWADHPVHSGPAPRA